MIDKGKSNCVIVNFPVYAGGKFIINCLSLSKYTHPQTSIRHLLAVPDDYSYRFNLVNQSLPPKDKIRDWRNFELGNTKYSNPPTLVWGDWLQGDRFRVENLVGFDRLEQSGLKFFLVTHGNPANLLRRWPAATMIVLENYQKFQRLAISLKSDNLELLENLPVTDLIGCSATNTTLVFDIDSCIFDQEKFLPQIKMLYNDLGFDDFNCELVLQYYNSYMALHL